MYRKTRRGVQWAGISFDQRLANEFTDSKTIIAQVGPTIVKTRAKLKSCLTTSGYATHSGSARASSESRLCHT